MSGNMKDAFKKAGYNVPNRQAPQSMGGSAQAQFKLEDNYAFQAEQVIRDLQHTMKKYKDFTTSKIRNILSQVSEIYNDVNLSRDETLSPELQSRIEYLKVRLAYECGREPEVIKPFVKRAGLLELLDGIGGSRENFIKYSRYMEALVAYHRFHGGKDS